MCLRDLIHLFWFLEDTISQSHGFKHLGIFGFPFIKSVIFSYFHILRTTDVQDIFFINYHLLLLKS